MTRLLMRKRRRQEIRADQLRQEAEEEDVSMECDEVIDDVIQQPDVVTS